MSGGFAVAPKLDWSRANVIAAFPTIAKVVLILLFVVLGLTPKRLMDMLFTQLPEMIKAAFTRPPGPPPPPST